jgi:hypothetical protein
MKKYIKSIKSAFSLIMIFVLLIQQFGCTSTKVISTNDLKIYPEYGYKIYYGKKLFALQDPVIANGVLTGKVLIKEPTHMKKIIQIYPVSDSVISIKSEVLSLPINKISTLKQVKSAPGKTTALIIGSSLSLIFALAAIPWQSPTSWDLGL